MAGDGDMLDALEALLAEERAALRQGAFDTLQELGARKERLIAEIGASGGGGSAARVTRLKRAAQRNEALCAAAVDGMRLAMARLSDLARLDAGASTYDAAGRRGAPHPSGRLGRRD